MIDISMNDKSWIEKIFWCNYWNNWNKKLSFLEKLDFIKKFFCEQNMKNFKLNIFLKIIFIKKLII